MTESNSVGCNETSNLSTTPLDNQQFRLNKINEIKEYFIAEIKERELMSKTLASILLFVIILINL